MTDECQAEPRSNEVLSRPEIVRFEFEGFEGLPSNKDVNVVPTNTQSYVKCHCNHWNLELYPGGDEDSEEGMVSAFLFTKGDDIGAFYSFIVRNVNNSVAFEKRSDGWVNFTEGYGHGFANFLPRADIIEVNNNILVNGKLIIDVEIRVTNGIPVEEFYVPPNHVCKNMLRLLESGDMANAAFHVQKTTFYAHRLILEVNAPVLAKLCEGKNIKSPITIDSTAPEIFRLLLRFVYGGELPDLNTMMTYNREIISASDEFGIAGLKLKVESLLVGSGLIDVSNAAELILFADAKKCPLLKEHAISFFVVRAKDVMETEYFPKLNGSGHLVKELMAALFFKGEKASLSEDDAFYEALSVDTLRRKLHELDLGVDGTRDMLVSRLKSRSD